MAELFRLQPETEPDRRGRKAGGFQKELKGLGVDRGPVGEIEEIDVDKGEDGQGVDGF